MERFFVIIIDDGSVAQLKKEEVRQFVGSNLQFEIVTLPSNAGITNALNVGLQWIVEQLDTPYIARLDCGDICHVDRFHKQVSFLNKNREVYLLGTWCKFKSHETQLEYTYTTPLVHKQIYKELYFRNVFIHPTVMFRTDLLSTIGHYPADYTHVEDYAFFWKIAKCFKTAILDDFLMTCEINPKGISIKNREQQIKGRLKVVKAFGESFLLKCMGMTKLLVLDILPYGLVLKLK